MHTLTSGLRRRTQLIMCAALVVGATALIAASARADFSDPPCTGATVGGSGSTLQNFAQQQLWSSSVFPGVICPGGPTVTYNQNGDQSGSGAGRNAMGALDGIRSGGASCSGAPCNPGGSRFAGTDEPPTPSEVSNMDNGPTSSTADDAEIHVIPVAGAAIAVVVNLPTSCTTLSGGAQTNFNADLDTTGRVKITNAQLVGMFDHSITAWGTILNTGDATCDNTPIKRVVRADSSGSTFAFKSFLNAAIDQGGLGVAHFDTANNTSWPAPGTPSAGDCSTTDLCQLPPVPGGPGLALELESDNGGIGYLALPDARNNAFDFDGVPSDTTYWIRVEAVGTSTFFDPTASTNGWKSTTAAGGPGPHGSNCLTTSFSNVPGGADPTLGDWSNVNGTGSTTGYPICTLTYDLAWDDDAAAYDASQAEQNKARTVKDYLTGVVSAAGQAGLLSDDYVPLASTPLPGRSQSLLSIAQAGVAAIGWAKSQSANLPTTTTVATPPPPPPPVITPPAPNHVSNTFSITSAKVSKAGAIVVTLQLPGTGRVSVAATSTYKRAKLTVAHASASVRGGTGTITLQPSSATRSALKKTTSLKVTVTVTFSPTGGSAATRSKSLTLKAPPKPPKKTKPKKHRR